MHSIDRDYTYLLNNLVPHHRLTPDRRRDIHRALGKGKLAEIRHASVLALEELYESAYFNERTTEAARDDVLVTYSRNDGHYQLRVRVPQEQWRRVGAQPIPQVAMEQSDRLGLDIVPEIIRSLAIDEDRESLVGRLESVLERFPDWLGVAGERLTLCAERIDDRHLRNAHLEAMPEKTILTHPFYKQTLRSSESQFVDVKAARALGLDEPSHLSHASGLRLAVTPILSSGVFWGVLQVWMTTVPDNTNDMDRVDIGKRMIEQIIDNANRLKVLTSIDKLTQVYNRRFYDKQIRIEIERATRSGTKLAMLVLDIDDFKQLNDAHNHQVGDRALTLVAELIRTNLRKIDLPFRYGGEEFVILLPGTAEVEAIHTAERLRSVVAETNELQGADQRPIEMRVSIGAAVFPDHAHSEDELFRKADEALLRAKRKGKNRVEFVSDP